jgi:hypothetical protein
MQAPDRYRQKCPLRSRYFHSLQSDLKLSYFFAINIHIRKLTDCHDACSDCYSWQCYIRRITVLSRYFAVENTRNSDAFPLVLGSEKLCFYFWSGSWPIRYLGKYHNTYYCSYLFSLKLLIQSLNTLDITGFLKKQQVDNYR